VFDWFEKPIVHTIWQSIKDFVGGLQVWGKPIVKRAAMKRTEHIDVLLARFPTADPERVAIGARASAYSRDCGCKMGALFLAGALLLVVVYFLWVGAVSFRTGVAGIVFIFVAAVSGKAAGLGLASLKLALLRRSVLQKLQSERSLEHVHMH
jgi:hypothetical protein